MFSIGSFTLGTLVGILLTSITNHFLAKSRDKENREKEYKQQAGRKLRDAFSDALNAVDPHLVDEEDAYTVLEKSFKEHLQAVNLYRTCLSTSERTEFDEAWADYYSFEGDGTKFLEQYSSHIGSHELYLQNCELGRQRILRILSFIES